jgi:hypothetical protein
MASSYAVRMSFRADQAFFPYSEPQEKHARSTYFVPRSLRIFLVGEGKMQANFGSSATGNPWGATLKYSNKLNSDQITMLQARSKLESDQLPANSWLNAFEDLSSPRPGTDDVVFSGAADQSPIEPQPKEYIIDERVMVPLEGVVLVTVVGIWLGNIVMAKRKKAVHK